MSFRMGFSRQNPYRGPVTEPHFKDYPVLVAALYRFAPVADTSALRERLIALCGQEVRGTLLVAHEGINGTIAGPHDAIKRVVDGIYAEPGFDRLELKYSGANEMPFYRMKVRIKAEIVTMGLPDLDPVNGVGTYVKPQDWNALIADPDTVIIDTRNDYEFEIGTFKNAIQPNTKTFREFAEWFEKEGRDLVTGPNPPKVAMFCTGGIRCEKSTAYLKSEGIQEVHHLEGGILKYLEEIPEPQSLWQGECFVFDERVSVGHGLKLGEHTLCRACRMPVSVEGMKSDRFVEGVSCDRCWDERGQERRAAYAERQHQIELAKKRGSAHIGTDAKIAAEQTRQRAAQDREMARKAADAAKAAQ